MLRNVAVEWLWLPLHLYEISSSILCLEAVIVTDIFHDFLHYLHPSMGHFLKAGNAIFIPHHFQFIIHYYSTCEHYIHVGE